MARVITLAHSPDADDAFMFFAIAKEKIDARGLEFRHEMHDIETLNRRAAEQAFDVTAMSFAAYPRFRRNYLLLDCGASVGDGYGPLVVSKRPLTRADLGEVTVAVPGELTTAFLALRLFAAPARHRVVPFDRILECVAAGEADAGLVIHEGQLTYRDLGLKRVADLGEWWKLDTGLPLPLGANAIRRDIDRATARNVQEVLRESFRYALEHREEALDYALSFSRGLDRGRADRFVGMYVNDFTISLGPKGREAVETLLRYGRDAGLVPGPARVEFVS